MGGKKKISLLFQFINSFMTTPIISQIEFLFIWYFEVSSIFLWNVVHLTFEMLVIFKIDL